MCSVLVVYGIQGKLLCFRVTCILLRKLLLTCLIRLKNTCKRRKVPSKVNCRGMKKPAAVNCRGKLSSAVNCRCVSATNLAEAPSSIITLILSKFSKLSLKNSTKSYQIYPTKSQVSHHKAINLHFSCYNFIFFSF